MKTFEGHFLGLDTGKGLLHKIYRYSLLSGDDSIIWGGNTWSVLWCKWLKWWFLQHHVSHINSRGHWKWWIYLYLKLLCLSMLRNLLRFNLVAPETFVKLYYMYNGYGEGGNIFGSMGGPNNIILAGTGSVIEIQFASPILNMNIVWNCVIRFNTTSLESWCIPSFFNTEPTGNR